MPAPVSDHAGEGGGGDANKWKAAGEADCVCVLSVPFEGIHK